MSDDELAMFPARGFYEALDARGLGFTNLPDDFSGVHHRDPKFYPDNYLYPRFARAAVLAAFVLKAPAKTMAEMITGYATERAVYKGVLEALQYYVNCLADGVLPKELADAVDPEILNHIYYAFTHKRANGDINAMRNEIVAGIKPFLDRARDFNGVKDIKGDLAEVLAHFEGTRKDLGKIHTPAFVPGAVKQPGASSQDVAKAAIDKARKDGKLYVLRSQDFSLQSGHAKMAGPQNTARINRIIDRLEGIVIDCDFTGYAFPGSDRVPAVPGDLALMLRQDTNILLAQTDLDDQSYYSLLAKTDLDDRDYYSSRNYFICLVLKSGLQGLEKMSDRQIAEILFENAVKQRIYGMQKHGNPWSDEKEAAAQKMARDMIVANSPKLDAAFGQANPSGAAKKIGTKTAFVDKALVKKLSDRQNQAKNGFVREFHATDIDGKEYYVRVFDDAAMEGHDAIRLFGMGNALAVAVRNGLAHDSVGLPFLLYHEGVEREEVEASTKSMASMDLGAEPGIEAQKSIVDRAHKIAAAREVLAWCANWKKVHGDEPVNLLPRHIQALWEEDSRDSLIQDWENEGVDEVDQGGWLGVHRAFWITERFSGEEIRTLENYARSLHGEAKILVKPIEVQWAAKQIGTETVAIDPKLVEALKRDTTPGFRVEETVWYQRPVDVRYKIRVYADSAMPERDTILLGYVDDPAGGHKAKMLLIAVRESVYNQTIGLPYALAHETDEQKALKELLARAATTRVGESDVEVTRGMLIAAHRIAVAKEILSWLKSNPAELLPRHLLALKDEALRRILLAEWDDSAVYDFGKPSWLSTHTEFWRDNGFNIDEVTSLRAYATFLHFTAEKLEAKQSTGAMARQIGNIIDRLSGVYASGVYLDEKTSREVELVDWPLDNALRGVMIVSGDRVLLNPEGTRHLVLPGIEQLACMSEQELARLLFEERLKLELRSSISQSGPLDASQEQGLSQWVSERMVAYTQFFGQNFSAKKQSATSAGVAVTAATIAGQQMAGHISKLIDRLSDVYVGGAYFDERSNMAVEFNRWPLVNALHGVMIVSGDRVLLNPEGTHHLVLPGIEQLSNMNEQELVRLLFKERLKLELRNSISRYAPLDEKQEHKLVRWVDQMAVSYEQFFGKDFSAEKQKPTPAGAAKQPGLESAVVSEELKQKLLDDQTEGFVAVDHRMYEVDPTLQKWCEIRRYKDTAMPGYDAVYLGEKELNEVDSRGSGKGRLVLERRFKGVVPVIAVSESAFAETEGLPFLLRHDIDEQAAIKARLALAASLDGGREVQATEAMVNQAHRLAAAKEVLAWCAYLDEKKEGLRLLPRHLRATKEPGRAKELVGEWQDISVDEAGKLGWLVTHAESWRESGFDPAQIKILEAYARLFNKEAVGGEDFRQMNTKAAGSFNKMALKGTDLGDLADLNVEITAIVPFK